MNNPSKKWQNRKYGYQCPGKFGIGTKKSETKRRIIRSDKRKSKKLLDEYFKE